MTQATQPAAAPPASATAGPAPKAPKMTGRARSAHAVVDVPRLLNRWQVLAVAACLLFAALTAGLQVLSWNANRAAADNTEQLVRVQNIQSTLFRADALATTAFLVGGLEPPEQRQAYDDAIDQVTRQIADAAEAQPADREVLAALNAAVNDFTSTNVQARDYNRQGYPVSTEYLRNASTQLRDEALPLMAALTEANSARAEDELGSQHPFLILLPGLGALLVLWWVNGGLAAKFRRRFNIGVMGAFVVVLLLTLVAGAVATGQASDNDDLRDGSYRRAVDEASARTAANDAKSNESRRLGAQGSGAPFEEGWRAAAETVTERASDDTLPLWSTYAGLHERVVELDEGGKYAEAVALATSRDDSGSTAALEAFDTAAQDVVEQAAADTSDQLRDGNTTILVLAGLTLLLGLVAAGLSTWGIAQRRREYA